MLEDYDKYCNNLFDSFLNISKALVDFETWHGFTSGSIASGGGRTSGSATGLPASR
jgi:hypothetical protein